MAKTLNDLWVDMLIAEGIVPTAGKTINDMLYEMLEAGQLGRKSAGGGLPKTGQTVKYQDGDDGDYQKGGPSSGDRFTDNGDGTVKDNGSGLIWIKQPELIIPGASIRTDNQIQVAKGTWATETVFALADLIYDDIGALYYVCAVPHTSGSVDFATDLAAHPTYWRQTIWTADASGLTTPAFMDWATAIVNCEALDYAGHDDWRLPNIKELQSLVDYGVYSPAIDSSKFPNGQSDYYWSGTTYVDGSGFAWIVDFFDGSVGFGGKTGSYYVRPVRSSQ